MKTNILTVLCLLISVTAFGQKKILDHPDFDIWNTIENQRISRNGEFIMYSLEKGEEDNFLKIQDANGNVVFEYDRGYNGQFTFDSGFAVFTIKPWQSEVRELKRQKTKNDDMPKDTLGILNLKTKALAKIPMVRNFRMPQMWSGFLAYQLDVNAVASDKGEKPSGKNGYHTIIRNLNSGQQDTLKYVKKYAFAKEGHFMSYALSPLATQTPGVYVQELNAGESKQIFSAEKAEYPQMSISASGEHVSFVADLDTTKALVKPNALYSWSKGMGMAQKLVDSESAPDGYRVSADRGISYAEDESKLYFGLATPPILQDTSLLDEEIVNVEVWTYDEPRLYTVQELQVENDRRKSYLTAIHLNKGNQLVQLANPELPNVTLGNEGNAKLALASTSAPYELQRQWEGGSYSDYSLVDVETGAVTSAFSKVRGQVRLSPGGNYAYGYSAADSAWFAYNVNTANYRSLTKGEVFYNELNDSPNFPNAYGSAGWTEDDKSILIYDRYDIWEYNPETGEGERITKGREQSMTYRYVALDNEARFIDKKEKWLLTTFNNENKHSGYYELNPRNGRGKQLVEGPFRYGRPIKAQDDEQVMFTKESFVDFPNIHVSDLSFGKTTQVSDANPQQSEYNWGTSELVHWTSLDGKQLTGMLIKPENFDPNKKYPMIVNFYEKSSDGVFGHRPPAAGRSTISYSWYTSRGYVIFNPDVHYRIGYPGESALNSVVPGVTSLVEKGFIDKDNIGVQGHSWGGYQIAYLVTKTDIFKAAESGAPVPNMISAYGGIRWWTGLSRQFQYEHTQSRIGGTPWEYPARYIENSPIFNIDKINTPLLIMHNDADGHVPWYQGIEFFVSLRRLGKPSWFLNYNGEPHWPLKRQNRKDFNVRMAQFFDYYLKGTPKPVWMERGVPALEKGINQGLELTNHR
ncbi:S9 family peptidase [Roseivirga sp. E12]|uniref:alpha/beta hydrolase family protein n=1 Tax=Roseivirga sp. E12 TaxID=2819237 RepID=UPI001ABCD698|nr:prolyl oligopeptidase family serine peptidase [Roseivirga sp. E12]MBO3700250.1 S9 family peptidase [Roseivirga sp. E12]